VSVVLGLVLLLAPGCSQPAEPALQPKLRPPAIKVPGVLRVGVNPSYPPFAGEAKGQQAGIDVDVAQALATRLGLKAQLIDVKPSEIATALSDGTVDVALSAPFSAAVLSRASIAGTYLSDGPAVFVARESTVSVPATVTPPWLATVRTGAQASSPSYWLLAEQIGAESVNSFPTLRGALEALSAGSLQAVVGDGLVGAYIARDLPGVRYGGQLAPASPVGVAVSTDDTKLSDAVRSALDSMAGEGVLSAIRAKWVGDLPTFAVPVAADETGTP
jgi:ABC-type amino acid transport substrate-binding protein